MVKKDIQNSSIEQIKNDHETETAFQVDNPNKKNKGKDNNK
ncbi:biofilm-forming protein [Metabacillus litoralis]|uniref:Biofilm-forming protein n=1 Tax=Metabacillus litoralis TaxID=152268 RepID=A0A5C6W7I9_9BACI|nr:biofilm-forming protein [Metabacillus litoralis]TXC91766.1 biofilm-forming protein [Metabacillus litoralis]